VLNEWLPPGRSIPAHLVSPWPAQRPAAPIAKPVETGGGMGEGWDRAAACTDISLTSHAPEFWMTLTFVKGTRGRPRRSASAEPPLFSLRF